MATQQNLRELAYTGIGAFAGWVTYGLTLGTLAPTDDPHYELVKPFTTDILGIAAESIVGCVELWLAYSFLHLIVVDPIRSRLRR